MWLGLKGIGFGEGLQDIEGVYDYEDIGLGKAALCQRSLGFRGWDFRGYRTGKVMKISWGIGWFWLGARIIGLGEELGYWFRE